ncbi:hypothetical protein LCGC14_0239700 [marine sediment metagenome]|uniref:LamG-like jellyroll fold domain-containing protein n=1 Tax=marine sediment metagenome TaxID=412755 RepID=A0A0F9XC63_9ZZZZ|nr:LamG-like jellyroll fold domain-containing protein [Maribacter sp.]HDZ04278.1 LamG domain-containing protein [Maribacter sp.]
MNNFKNIITVLLATLLLVACEDGIDSLTEVDPGADETAPNITITSPTEGLAVKVNEELATITIKFEAVDDIELESVGVLLDGSSIKKYTDFLDYRRLIVDDLMYDKLADGEHVLTISATDLDGKTTNSSVNFTKEPAYISKYPGEILYMPFDGAYVDLISFEEAQEFGNPSISEENIAGDGSYAGAADTYLTLDSERFKNTEFSAIFWMKVNSTPDRAGILTLSPPLIDGTDNDLSKGFRFFRENANGMQRFKLNVGTGTDGTWFDGGEAADVDPTTNEWVNLAFTITGSEATVYIDGQIVKEGDLAGIDWTGANVLSIMSGAPNFTAWNHLSDESLLDELRIFNRAITQQEIQQIMADDSGLFVSSYPPTFDGEMFYMPFDGSYNERFRNVDATEVGTPTFADESVEGDNAYAGATDSYLTFPANESGAITTDEFSTTLWYKLNANPTRGAILVMGPEDVDNAGYPDVQNKRTNGFRFFREGDATRQVFKLNVGNGEADSWFDGGDAAALDPSITDWVHLAFTISGTECVVYIDGEVVAQGDFTGVDWTGCDMLSIGSGAPRFTEWGHGFDLSFIDELRLYNKALSQQEIQEIRQSGL